MALDFNSSKNASRMQQMQQKMLTDSNATISKSLPLSSIVENEDNESIYGMDKLDELVSIIEEDGFTDPIGVYDLGNGTYEIFSGHKRYRAMKKKGEKTIPSVIYPKPKDDVERAKRLIRSNSLNRDYSPITKAKELLYFYEHVTLVENKPGKKRLQLAKEFGMSEGQVSKYLALLKLIPELQALTERPELSFSAFSTAAQISEECQYKLYEYIEQKKTEDGTYMITRDEIQSKIKQLQRIEECARTAPFAETTIESPQNIVIETVPQKTKAEEGSIDKSGNVISIHHPAAQNPEETFSPKVQTLSEKLLSSKYTLEQFLFAKHEEIAELSALVIDDKDAVRKSIEEIRKDLQNIEKRL